MIPIQKPITLEQLVIIARNVGGKIMKDNFRGPTGIAYKSKDDLTWVTEIDISINNVVIRKIRHISRDVSIVGEEVSDLTDSEWVVIVDPIDGTAAMVFGFPVCVFMIALLYRGTPVFGVIYHPFTQTMYAADAGKGASMNNRKIVTSAPVGHEPIIGVSIWPGHEYLYQVCDVLSRQGFKFRMYDSIGYMDAAVARGAFAATIFPGDKAWDSIPGWIIVKEAGKEAGAGTSDIHGQPLAYRDGKLNGHIFSYNEKVHAQILEAMRSCA